MTIRFRVFHCGEMYYPRNKVDLWDFVLGQNGNVYSCEARSFEDPDVVLIEDAIAMLSTGLTDKNGHEVWAGDLMSDDSEIIGRVVMDHGSWCVETKEADGSVSFDLLSFELSQGDEVVGNIHENPELLEDI